MPPKLPPKTYKVQEKAKAKEKEKTKPKEKEKKNKTQLRSNKVGSQLNPHCSKCPHKPPQSLTPKDSRKLQKQENYKKLYKIT